MDSEKPLLPQADPQSDELLPELNCFFLSGARHDRDRIEIQIGFDGLIPKKKGEFSYDVDCVIFCPKTLGLVDVENTDSLRHEFQSYIRLHTHASNPKDVASINRVKERLDKMKSNLSLESLRFFAIEFEGFLKGKIKRVRKHSLSQALLASELESIGHLISELRNVLRARGLEGQDCDLFERKTTDHDLLLLNEYISHIYVQYLVEFYNASRLSPETSEIIPLIESHMRFESEQRTKYQLLSENRHGPQSTPDEEGYARRMSILKKYFQRALFVQVQGETLAHRALIPVYAVSAALAGSWAIGIQMYQVRSLEERISINSITFVSIAIAAYVAKDIMKDIFRRYFLKKSTVLFPDYEKTLLIKRGGKRKKLGQIKEYIRNFDSEVLPPDLQLYRYGARGGELEQQLHEDIVHFKKRVTLDLSQLETNREFPWGMREILRYRFDRLLTSMEDPYKRTHFLSRLGIPGTRQAHRTYHIYVAVWIKHDNEIDPENPTNPAFKAFKVVLDKTGILDCLQLESPVAEIPSVP
jgi:hypothetical protein